MANVGFKNPTYAVGAIELLLFCKVIFLDWYETLLSDGLGLMRLKYVYR